MRQVFIIGAKGIPGAYGGYETFVDRLTFYHQHREDIRYHVACKDTRDFETEVHNARCFHIRVPDIGPAQAIWYDVAALKNCCDYIRRNGIEKPVVYILACRIGPFMGYFAKKIHRLGGVVWVNPDGHEWKRAKWSAPVRAYWKLSEKQMVRHGDLMVCDSRQIEDYIRREYAQYRPATTYIAYGAETGKSPLTDTDPSLVQWYADKGLTPGGYYLTVGRFVPENNFETMLREFMASDTKRDLALITNVSAGFLEELKKRTGFHRDPRIKFVGTVYDQPLLRKIREKARGYLHGHEVGGTNPSLLEALGSTRLNLLLDVGFNREVAGDAALYWTREPGSLAEIIARADALDREEILAYETKAKRRIAESYSWEFICHRYARLILESEK